MRRISFIMPEARHGQCPDICAECSLNGNGVLNTREGHVRCCERFWSMWMIQVGVIISTCAKHVSYIQFSCILREMTMLK